MIFSSSAFQFTLGGILCSPFKTTAGKSNYIGSTESQPLSLYQRDLQRDIYVIAYLAFFKVENNFYYSIRYRRSGIFTRSLNYNHFASFTFLSSGFLWQCFSIRLSGRIELHLLNYRKSHWVLDMCKEICCQSCSFSFFAQTWNWHKLRQQQLA